MNEIVSNTHYYNVMVSFKLSMLGGQMMPFFQHVTKNIIALFIEILSRFIHTH